MKKYRVHLVWGKNSTRFVFIDSISEEKAISDAIQVVAFENNMASDLIHLIEVGVV